MPFCTHCGQQISDEAVFCPECGTSVAAQSYSEAGPTKVCKKCGESMPVDMFYCLNCGAPFEDESESLETIQARLSAKKQVNTTQVHPKVVAREGSWRNKWVALLLCLFLGGLGIHRFYEGKVVTGLLYLFTLGFFGVGWFIDIIRIVCKPNPYRVK